MKTALVLVLVVLAALVQASPAPAAAKERKTKELSEVLQEAAREGKQGLRAAALPLPAPDQPAGARGLAACYQPGCEYQCRTYGYNGGFCDWGSCKCWYW